MNNFMKRTLQLFTFFMLAFSLGSMAQSVTGTVTDASDKMTLPGVNVIVQGTTVGVTTDFDGYFEIELPEGSSILEFSFMGYVTQTVDVAGKSTADVELVVDSKALDEVVVTALGIKRDKKALGYALQEVDGKDMTEARETNIANSLTGKVAGVNINSSGTGTGGSTRIIIRGNSSLSANNQPLIVVDGIPMDNFTSNTDDRWGNQVIDRGNGMADINPDDVETMSVLKGPAAAALYGSRAANGVILITTKSGKGTKGIGVTYNGNVTFETLLTSIDLQNKYGQGTGGHFVINGLSSWGPKMEGQEITDYTGKTRPFSAYDNHIEDFLNTGVKQSHSVAISAGNEKINFRGNIGYDDIQGIVPNNSIKKYNVNLRTTAQITDKLSVDFKVNYIIQDGENRPKLAQDPDNIFLNYIQMPRSIHYGDLTNYRNADLTPFRWGENGGMILNPYFTVNLNTNWDKRNRILAFGLVDYKFTDWLTGRVRYGLDSYTSTNQTQLGTGVPYWYQTGNVIMDVQSFYEGNADFLLTADKSELFDTKWGASLSVGGNMMQTQNRNSNMNANGLVVPDFYSINNGQNIRATHNLYEKKINSLYAFGQFRYDTWLYLDWTARNDWSSTLPSDNRSYFYPSVGAGVIMSDLFEMPKAISFFKLRASWAQVGNDTDPYKLSQYLEGYNVGGQNGNKLPSQLPLAGLLPEINTSIEFGVDFRMFDNRLGLDVTYYDSKARNQIISLPVAPETGYDSKLINAGIVGNKGIEIILNGTPIRTDDFEWNIAVNWSKNNNEIIELHPESDTYILSQGGSQVEIIAREGGTYGEIRGSYYMRDASGNIELDGEGLPVVSQDKKVLGSTIPDWLMGINNQFSYKSFSLSFLFDFREGGDIYSGSVQNAAASGTLLATADGRDDYYNGTTTVNPEAYWGRKAGVDEQWIYDTSNIRLRELSLGYSLPSAVLDKTPFTNAKFSIVGRNLWLLKNNLPGIDPASTYSTGNAQGLELGAVPSTRTIGFNLNLAF